MAYIAGLIIAGLFFLSLHYFTELTKAQKIAVASITLAVIFAAIAFNAYSTHKRESMLAVVLAFKQGKTVKCNTREVNTTNYTLSIGTYTFIGKKGTPNYAEMISAASCE